jgi:oligoribonuclease
MPNLIICDCETTGLDEAKDYVIEVALFAVSLPTFEEVVHLSAVVVPPLWPTVKRNMPEKVLEMHTASGLIAEVDRAHDEGRNATGSVEQAMLAFMSKVSPHTPVWKTPLGGANPDFDRRFLRKRMPKLEGAFHYRNWDVRSITQLQDWVFGVQHVESPHRALPDARKAAADVRAFLGLS